MYNFSQNIKNKSVVSVLTCIKRYLQTQFEFNSEKVGLFFKKVAICLFSISQYAYLPGCPDVISVGRAPVFCI